MTQWRRCSVLRPVERSDIGLHSHLRLGHNQFLTNEKGVAGISLYEMCTLATQAPRDCFATLELQYTLDDERMRRLFACPISRIARSWTDELLWCPQRTSVIVCGRRRAILLSSLMPQIVSEHTRASSR